ncbi:hypothetical protein V5O48_014052 [Marasmius crinis-equi]|uniref:Uncharacterized protein n=1 Tax=Marasmius crinis-equi TaxID=585013 RepID=A0ABR3EYE1_9AGAR
MSDTVLSKAISFGSLLILNISIPSGSYAGLSGHDSLARSMCTLVDPSVSLLVFYGLVNLCFFPNRGGLARMNIIHTTRPGNDQKKNLVNFRASWWDIGNTAARSGKFEIEWSNGGYPSVTDPEGSLPDIRVAPNSNHWIYPYMLGKQPYQQSGSSHTDPVAVVEIRLTRRALIRTAALAIARFGFFLASSFLIILLHMFIVAFFYEDSLFRTLLILGDLGRWLLVVGQLSSIMTYSLDYKGVCSWGSPEAFKRNPLYGSPWSLGEQLFCRDEVLRYIGRAYHARLVFLLYEYLWPKISRRMPPQWARVWGTENNRGIFATFTCLGDRYFDDTQSTLLRLHVKPRGTGDLCNDFTSAGSYAVDFKVPTLLVQYCFPKRLEAVFWLRVWNFIVLGPLCLCSIAVPYILVWRESDSKVPALIVLGVFQIITAVFTYKDIDNWSINCKFQPDPPPAPETEQNAQSNPGDPPPTFPVPSPHVCYPPVPAATGGPSASTSTSFQASAAAPGHHYQRGQLQDVPQGIV